jgi:NADH-quinone oxidoreductase subunit N
MIFLSIELFGVPAFILTGYLRHQERSSEAAIKFFLIGAFSSAMLAYGISLIYGLIGSTSLLQLHQNLPLLQDKAPLALLIVFFLIVSFGFKIALVPFHMWVPDVFEGAPTPIAAFVSVAPKIAGAAIAVRVLGLTLAGSNLGILNVVAVLAVLTMTVANIIGLQQTNIVRLLAYSSIAHMGYLLLGLVASSSMGLSSVYIYGWAYLFMNMGAFAVVISLGNETNSQELSSYAGMAKRAPFVSALLVLFLVSLAGLPPTAGFLAKFYVFSSAFQSHWTWLVLAAAVNSVISIGYYFKILHAMYFQKSATETPIVMPLSARFTLAVTSFFTLFIGVFPQIYMVKSQSLADSSQAKVAAIIEAAQAIPTDTVMPPPPAPSAKTTESPVNP